jgi:hypothetical protein
MKVALKMDVRSWGMLIVSFSCLVVFAAPVASQIVSDPAKARMQDMDRRELQLNKLTTDSVPAHNLRRSALMNHVTEDFRRLLILHNELVRAFTSNRSLTNQFISDTTGEIRKRSARLQSSLKLPKPETTDNHALETDFKGLETKDELLLLCRQIESFVRNPIIDQPGTIDAQQLEKARKDLQSVVGLSDAIKKQVDKQKP